MVIVLVCNCHIASAETEALWKAENWMRLFIRDLGEGVRSEIHPLEI